MCADHPALGTECDLPRSVGEWASGAFYMVSDMCVKYNAKNDCKDDC